MPMGQQEYEHQLTTHLRVAGIDVRTVRVRSWRSTLVGEKRLPLNAATQLPIALQQLLALATYGSQDDLVHRADLRLPAALNEVVTVHDLAPLRFDDEGTISRRALRSLARARAVICPSQFAADEVRDLAGVDGAVVIPNGIDPAVWSEADEGMLDGLDLPSPFVLHSGGATRRKNLAALADAWRVLAATHADLGLVLCGPPDDRRSALFADLPRVRMLGRVSRPLQLALMSAATVVVVPSTYEGFGFPALEAMALGTAVVAANAAALPEVCGTAARLVTPDGGAIADAVSALLDDESERTQLCEAGVARAAGFTWERSALAHAALYESVKLGRGRSRAADE